MLHSYHAGDAGSPSYGNYGQSSSSGYSSYSRDQPAAYGQQPVSVSKGSEAVCLGALM